MLYVRSRLRTAEQKKYFDFITDIPKDFAMKYAGERWTHERLASYLKIEQSRIPSLNKALKRAFHKQMELRLIRSKVEWQQYHQPN